MMNFKKQNYLFIAKAIGLFIISPIYVTAVILWQERKEVINFYSECFQVFKGTHPYFKDLE